MPWLHVQVVFELRLEPVLQSLRLVIRCGGLRCELHGQIENLVRNVWGQGVVDGVRRAIHGGRTELSPRRFCLDGRRDLVLITTFQSAVNEKGAGLGAPEQASALP